MSDIQRWRLVYAGRGIVEHMAPAPDGDSGGYVTYADHVAALAAQATAHEAALAKAGQKAVAEFYGMSNYAKGVSDERARIRAAVQALAAKYPKPSALIYETDVLAIIDGEDQ